MRKRRAFLLALVVFVAAGAALTGRVYPDLRQRQLDNRLLAAISRSDTPAVLSLLDQGANPNAHGDPTTGTMSLWQMLREYFTHRTPRLHHTTSALRLALGIDGEDEETVILYRFDGLMESGNTGQMVGSGENNTIVIALLEHGCLMPTAPHASLLPVAFDDKGKNRFIGFRQSPYNEKGGQVSTPLVWMDFLQKATPQQLIAFRKATKMDEKR